MESKMCIICRRYKAETEFNIEHIIPESIGNKHLKIDTVCKECNSRLGNKVDCEISNNIISQLDRFINRSRGKSGKIPNPFRQGKTSDGRIIYFDEDLKPSLVPSIDFDPETGRYNISASSIEEGVTIINKKLKRHGKPQMTDRQIEDLEQELKVKRERPSVKVSVKVDFYKIYLGFIKIAYEYMYYLVGNEYLKDQEGIKLARILEKYIYDDVKLDCNHVIDRFPYDKQLKMMSNFKFLGKELFGNENIHYIQLKEKEGLIKIYISLYSSFNYSVLVSRKQYKLSNSIEIINPVDGLYIRC